MTSPRVVSVCVGAVRDVEWRGTVISTGIWKSPVTGRVALRGVNLAGDDQADRTVHGGPDKAVYAYAREDYEYWRETEKMETPDGLFGENLTMRGYDLSSALVGERWRVGTTLLEVAQPRLPCYKLGIRVGDQRFLRTFMAALRPGAYLRVIEEGDVGADDVVDVVSRPGHAITLRYMVESLMDREKATALGAIDGLPSFWQEVAARR